MTRWLLDAARRQLLLAPPRASASRRERDAHLPSFDDPCWHDLPRLAEGHGVSGLIGPTARERLPETVRAAIEDTIRRTRLRDARLRHDLSSIRHVFQEEDIPCALLKGTALLENLWTEEVRRPRADLDLYVPPESLPRAQRALEDLGYVSIDQSWKHRRYLRPDNRAVVDRRGEHPRNPRPVELHPRIVESFRGIEWDLGSRSPIEATFQELTPSLLFCHLVAHATVDALERKLRLSQLMDLARLADGLDAKDLQLVTEVGRGPDRARFMWPALHWVERFVTPLPDTLSQAFRMDCSDGLRRWVSSVDPDALSYFGRQDRRRTLLEVPRIWPISRIEERRVWRFILLPRRLQLADRYPVLAGSRAWPIMYVRHALFSVRQALQRLSNRL